MTSSRLTLPRGLAIPVALALPLVLSLALATGVGAQPPLPRTLQDALAGVPPTPGTGFADVGADHWAAPAIRRVVDAGILEGYGGKFHGARDVDRFQMAAILDRLLRVQEDQTRTLVAAAAPPRVAEPDLVLRQELAETRDQLAEAREALATQQESLAEVRALFRPSPYKPW